MTHVHRSESKKPIGPIKRVSVGSFSTFERYDVNSDDLTGFAFVDKLIEVP